MRRLAAPLALLFVLPAEAMADIRFRGKSGQGRLVTLRTGDDGIRVLRGGRVIDRCHKRTRLRVLRTN